MPLPTPDVTTALGYWGVPLAVFAGAVRNSTPFLFVSLGETLTEKSGRINLGQEGTLVMGAMVGFGVSYLTAAQWPSVGEALGPWLGVICAGLAAALLGALHAILCSQPRVNDIAVGIGIMLFGVGLAFYLGKPFVQPAAPQLPALALGFWSHSPQVQAALDINWLFFIGVALAPLMWWMLKNTRWGLIVRTVGESVDAAKAMGYSVNKVRLIATTVGAFLAGVGGSFLSLYYPGSWNEGLSSGQGLMAVALVIFARWNPIYCLFAALLFGGSKALGPALQSIGFSQDHYLFDAAPYILTLLIMIVTCSSSRSLIGAPDELGKATV
jgi:general nucleoside transport system permease protein